MKISICNEMFEGWQIGKVCQYISQLGYQGLEIAPFTLCESVAELSTEERRTIRQTAEKYNIDLVGLHWVLVSPKGLYINHPEQTTRRKTINYFFELIKFCADLGGKIIVIGSPQQRQVLPEITYQQAWELAKDTFIKASQFAEEHNVILCLEPLRKDLTNFINKAEEAVKMIKEVNSPNFRLILDCYSMSTEEDSPPQTIEKYGEYLAHIHLNDDNRLGPGMGTIDYFPQIAQALKKINYQGYGSVEVFDFSPGPETIAQKSLEFIKANFTPL